MIIHFGSVFDGLKQKIHYLFIPVLFFYKTSQNLDQTLYDQYKLTNARILENEYLSFKADRSFRIKTPPLDKQNTDPLQAWFPKRYYISLAEILATVHHHSNTLSAFEHWQQTNTSKITSRPALLAGIIGLGCGIGVR